MRSHLFALIVVVGCGVAVIGQGGASPKPASGWTPSRTPDGQFDLEGVWDYSTITPLERPSALGNKQTFTDEEAVAFEREENLRQNRDLIDPKKGGAQYLPGSVIPYNEFWYERGNKIIGSKRTSLIIDPPDGRIPPLTPEAQQRLDALAAAARDEQLGRVRADSPQQRSLADRCILGFNAGPPMTPGAYNNHVQITQSPGYVTLVVEMVHDARIVPIDGRPHLPSRLRNTRGIQSADGKDAPSSSTRRTSCARRAFADRAPTCISSSA
jgi:hypothetical protein